MDPVVEVAIGIVVRRRRVLICQRLESGSFPGHWEFPGGKREADESLDQSLARELREELGITARPTATLRPIEHDYPGARIRLYPYICVVNAGDPRPLAAQRIEWALPPMLRDYAFPPANQRLIEEVIERLSST